MAFINLKNLKNNNDQVAWFLFDIFMVTLAFVNVNLIIFDFVFSYNLGYDFFYSIVPKFTIWYDTIIHQHFIFIDLAFVAIFLIEFLLRWIIATIQKDYREWWFFPFARWYDLLGLIPIGSFRFLRVLRIFSILARLHKMRVLNFREHSFFPFVNKYYNAFVEEVSDKVVINVLDGIQHEMRGEDEVAQRIVRDVIKPNNERMVNFALTKVQYITKQILFNNRENLKDYLQQKVDNAVNNNDEMKLIKSVPGLGGIIRKQLDSAIADITYKVIEGIVDDVANFENEEFLNKEINNISYDLMDTLENDQELEQIVKDITESTIEIIKEQVSKKNWLGEQS